MFDSKLTYRVRGPVRTQRPYGDAFSIKKTSTAQTRYEIKKTKAPKNNIYEIFNLQQKVYHVEIFV